MQSQMKVIRQERNLLDMNIINENKKNNNALINPFAADGYGYAEDAAQEKQEAEARSEARKALGLDDSAMPSVGKAPASNVKPLAEAANPIRVQKVADTITGFADSYTVMTILENLVGLTDNLYYNMTTARPVLRKHYDLDDTFALDSGDVTDITMAGLGAFLERNGVKLRGEVLEKGVLLASRGGKGQRATNAFKEMIRDARANYTADPGIIDEIRSGLGLDMNDYTYTALLYLLATVYYKQLYDGDSGTFQAPAFNLVFFGYQGSGKSAFFNELACGDGNQLVFSKRPDFRDKDIQTQMAAVWLINNDDMAGTSQVEAVAELKSEITKKGYQIRLPYGKHSATVLKRGTHVGSSNQYGFLLDDSGDRRTWVLETQVGKNKDEAKKAGTEFGEWLNHDKIMTLWATFDSMARDLDNPLDLVKPLLDTPNIEGERIRLVKAHKKQDPLSQALETVLNKLASRDPVPNPYTKLDGPMTKDGTAMLTITRGTNSGTSIGWEDGYINEAGFNELVRDELRNLEERTQGRTREIIEKMAQLGYTEDKNGLDGRRYKKN